MFVKSVLVKVLFGDGSGWLVKMKKDDVGGMLGVVLVKLVDVC